MDETSVREAAEILARAWLEAGSASAFAPSLRARTRADAYRIQDRMAEIIAEPVTGWKLGATSPAMRELAGHDGPIIGRVFESVTYASPALLRARRFRGARVECEFAFRLREPIAPGAAPAALDDLAALVELHAALEIIGNRYPTGAHAFTPGTADEIADNGAGIGFVFGPAIAGWRSLDLRQLPIELRVDAGPTAENFLGERRCDPIRALAEALGILAERGIGLAAGQYVSTGAATVPQPVQEGSVVLADFGGHASIEATFTR